MTDADRLRPVREYQLREARRAAAAAVAAARQDADAIVAAARRDATEAESAARDEGRALGTAQAAVIHGAAQEQARSIVLSARRAALDALRAQVLARAGALDADPAVRARLGTLAASTAGPGAVVTGSPSGGVLARSASVLVDCSLPRLAARAIGALGDQVSELWTP